MARESGRNDFKLKEEIARSRDRVTRDLRAVRYELDFPRKIRKSFRRQPIPWIAAAAALGLVLMVVPRRKKKFYVDAKGRGKANKLLEAGFLLGLLKIGATILKPVIVPFLREKVSEYASGSRPSKKW
jgi:hypothetical protein